MVISWSYVCSDFWLLWTLQALFLFCIFFVQTHPIFYKLRQFLKRCKKMQFLFIHIGFFFKKMELFVVCIFLFIHIIFFIHLGLSAWGYPPGYPPGYLMLPNLTNQFIKLSNGNLWRSSVWMKFGHFFTSIKKHFKRQKKAFLLSYSKNCLVQH